MDRKLLSVLLALFSFIEISGRIWYVKTNGNDALDGSSWANAKSGNWLYSLTGVQSGDEIYIAAGNYTGVKNIPIPKNFTLSFTGGFDTLGGCGETKFLTNNSGSKNVIFDINATTGSLNVTGITFEPQAPLIDNVTIARWTSQTSGTFYFNNVRIVNKRNTAFDWSAGGNQNLTLNFNNVSASGNSTTVFNFTGSGNRNFTVNFDHLYASNNQKSVIYAFGSGNAADTAPGTINVASSVFCSNGTYAGTDYGGAINAGQYLILNSRSNTYLNNRVRWTGAAISAGWDASGNNSGPIRFSSYRDYFEGNKAHKGGAIFYYQNENLQAEIIGNTPNFSVRESKFAKNWATGSTLTAWQYTEGGAIALMGVFLKEMPVIQDSEFYDQESGNDGGSIAVGTIQGGYGNQSPALYSLNNKFYDGLGGNINGYGGAISYYVSGAAQAAPSSPYPGKHIIIENNRFFRNKAQSLLETSYGGAIATQTNSSHLNVYILKSIFKGNYAKNNGGAIFTAGGNNMRIEESKFEDNYVSLPIDQSGGAVQAKNIIVDVVNSQFRHNDKPGGTRTDIEFDTPLIGPATFNISGGILQQAATRYTASWLKINNAAFNGNGLPELIPNENTTVVTLGNTCPADTNVYNCITVCYNLVKNTNPGIPVNHGITLLKRAGADNGNWPMNRNSAHTALESNTKGFVITRVATTAALSNISTPVEGMMVYDGEAKCLKIYVVDNTVPANTGWKCFSSPACP